MKRGSGGITPENFLDSSMPYVSFSAFSENENRFLFVGFVIRQTTGPITIYGIDGNYGKLIVIIIGLLLIW